MTEPHWNIHFTPVEPQPDSEYRYPAGPDIPDWLVGKTVTEVAAMNRQLYHEVIRQQTKRSLLSRIRLWLFKFLFC